MLYRFLSKQRIRNPLDADTKHRKTDKTGKEESRPTFAGFSPLSCRSPLNVTAVVQTAAAHGSPLCLVTSVTQRGTAAADSIYPPPRTVCSSFVAKPLSTFLRR